MTAGEVKVYVNKIGKTVTVDAAPSSSVADVKSRIEATLGLDTNAQRLTLDGEDLEEGRTIAECGAAGETGTFFLYDRQPGHVDGKVYLTVKPRVQKEKWSLYWKESMSTKTELLDDIDMEFEPSTPVSEVLRAIAEKFGWQPVESLLRLEGFTEAWELAVFEGKEVSPSNTLEGCGILGDAELTTVRKVLVAEGWKLVGEDGQDDSDTDDDDF